MLQDARWSIATSCIACVTAVLLSLPGCGDDSADDTPEERIDNGIVGVTRGFAVVVANQLPEGAGDRLFVAVLDGESVVGQSEAAAELGARVELQASAGDVVAYIPDSGKLEGSTFGPGFYARLSDVAEGSTLALRGMSRAEALPDAAGSLGMGTEPGPANTLNVRLDASVTEHHVAIDGRPQSHSGSASSDSLPVGTHTVVVVSGNRGARGTIEITADKGATFDPELELVEGPVEFRLVDKETGEPVPGARVFDDAGTTLDVGADGRFSLATAHVKDIRAEHYGPRGYLAWGAAGVVHDIRLPPLARELYGTWDLCRVRTWGSGWSESVAEGDPVTFRSGGTAILPQNSAGASMESDTDTRGGGSGRYTTGFRSQFGYLDSFELRGEELWVHWYLTGPTISVYAADCGPTGGSTGSTGGGADASCQSVCNHLAETCPTEDGFDKALEDCLQECANEQDTDHITATLACCADTGQEVCSQTSNDIWEMCEAACRD